MNWRAWRCWFRPHEYAFREVGLDARYPEQSAAVLDYFAEQFAGHRIGFNICGRCYHRESGGPVIPDGTSGTITLDEFIEKRYRDGVERIARQVEEQHGGGLKINVPSLRDEPIPLRDAMNIVTELDIAASKAEWGLGPISFSCWGCKSPITVNREQYRRKVRCPQCGKKQATPQQ